MNKLVLMVAAATLTNAEPLAAQDGSSSDTDAATLTIPQLCAMRSDPEAMAELERRDRFSRRELRAIEKDEIRKGIRPEALVCFMGRPDRVEREVAKSSGGVIDMYSYFRRGSETLFVYIGRRDDEEAVLDAFTPGTKSAGTPERARAYRLAALKYRSQRTCFTDAGKLYCGDPAAYPMGGADVWSP
jgi:hypothetical protein